MDATRPLVLDSAVESFALNKEEVIVVDRPCMPQVCGTDVYADAGCLFPRGSQEQADPHANNKRLEEEAKLEEDSAASTREAAVTQDAETEDDAGAPREALAYVKPEKWNRRGRSRTRFGNDVATHF